MNKEAKIKALEARIAALQSKLETKVAGSLKNKRVFIDFKPKGAFILTFRADSGRPRIYIGEHNLLLRQFFEGVQKQIDKLSARKIESGLEIVRHEISYFEIISLKGADPAGWIGQLSKDGWKVTTSV